MAWCFRCEYVRCGKDTCKRCPHGPYWYGYHKVAQRVHKRYFGKLDPREHKHPHPWDAVFNGQTASERLCCEILGVDEATSHALVRLNYIQWVKGGHPDRGGDPQLWAWRSAAWSFLRAARGWP